jgi:hypothetical protein
MNNRSSITAGVVAGKFTRFELSNSSAVAGLNLLSTARGSLMTLGLASMATLILMFFQPQLADELKEMSPFNVKYDALQDPQVKEFDDLIALSANDNADTMIFQSDLASIQMAANGGGPLVSDKYVSSLDDKQRRVARWLARRYHIASTASHMLVSVTYSSVKELQLDPLLVLAVMAIESRFNPLAESAVGAQGLMQVMPKINRDKFHGHGGVKAALNPIANIKVGAKILKEFIRHGGSVEAGLKLYVGAGNLATDGGYGSKVLQEYERLKAVSSGASVPVFTSVASPPYSGGKSDPTLVPSAPFEVPVPDEV